MSEEGINSVCYQLVGLSFSIADDVGEVALAGEKSSNTKSLAQDSQYQTWYNQRMVILHHIKAYFIL